MSCSKNTSSCFNNGQLNLSSKEKTYYNKSKVIYRDVSNTLFDPDTSGNCYNKKHKNHSLYLNLKYGHMFCKQSPKYVNDSSNNCLPRSETDFS